MLGIYIMATIFVMNWDKCLICQKEKDENLRGHKEGGSYETLAKLLPKFADIGAFPLQKFGCTDNETATIVAKF